MCGYQSTTDQFRSLFIFIWFTYVWIYASETWRRCFYLFLQRNNGSVERSRMVGSLYSVPTPRAHVRDTDCYWLLIFYYEAIRQHARYAITLVCLPFIHCVHDYCKSNQPISLKLRIMILSTNQKNLLTFGDGPFPDTDSWSLFDFPHRGGMRHFKRFISISHTVTGRFSRHSATWLTPTRSSNPRSPHRSWNLRRVRHRVRYDWLLWFVTVWQYGTVLCRNLL